MNTFRISNEEDNFQNLRRFLVPILLLFTSFFLSITSLHSQDYAPIPILNSPVVDKVGILNEAEKDTIISKILNLQKEKGSQIQVLIIPTTEPEAIEQYSIRLAEDWKIGRKNVDDGVILVIAIEDRKLRIEVGYGLEGAIPDVLAKRIIDQIITPSFKEGNFSGGIASGVDALIGLINGEELPAPDPELLGGEEGEWGLFSIVIGGIAVLIGLIFRVMGKIPTSIGIMFVLFTIAGLVSGIAFFTALTESFFFTLIALAVFFGNLGGGRGGGSGGWSSSGGGGWSGGGGSFGGGGSSGSW